MVILPTCQEFGTGDGRTLSVVNAMAKKSPVIITTVSYTHLDVYKRQHFWLWRLRGQSPFTVGEADLPRVLVCVEGAGDVEHGGATYAVGRCV